MGDVYLLLSQYLTNPKGTSKDAIDVVEERSLLTKHNL